tara:strand:+ start:1355 stop:1522 length:168 start_codon:yes stop_codon:yes gene_type:complete
VQPQPPHHHPLLSRTRAAGVAGVTSGPGGPGATGVTGGAAGGGGPDDSGVDDGEL